MGAGALLGLSTDSTYASPATRQEARRIPACGHGDLLLGKHLVFYTKYARSLMYARCRKNTFCSNLTLQ